MAKEHVTFSAIKAVYGGSCMSGGGVKQRGDHILLKEEDTTFKKDLETACKNMLLLAVYPGLKEANATQTSLVSAMVGLFLQSAVPVVRVLLSLNVIVILAFIALLIGESMTCCKRICRSLATPPD